MIGRPPVSDPTTRLRRAEALFHEALQRPSTERAEFLRQRCGDDVQLIHDVERLLAADAGEDGFLTSPALGPDFEMPAPDTLGDAARTRRIGPYQLVRLLASGGIGHVWLARRIDEHFEKDVALKLIKRGMDTDAILERFRQERQVLARLEHPNIARLIDGGATDDGLPYLVMEYVDGLPIDEDCRRRGLSVRQRLVLFREVCAAVAYAHRNLVVHRDLKPGNILVTDDGRPKLLDFGIAKVLAAEADGAPRTTTRFGPLMTPEYASPEQIRGEPVTTASDVYSLGVMLYELLTTLKPYEATPTRRDFERVVCETEPQRPSTRVLRAAAGADAELRTPRAEPAGWPEGDPARLARVLAGDLDTILLKTLRKEPIQRYTSVEQLSEDLRRYLERLPIAARPPTWAYRSRRFVQRHTAGVVASTVALTAVVTGLVVSSVAYVQAEAARRREVEQRGIADTRRAEAEAAQLAATAEAGKVRATNAFLQELLSTNDPLLKLRPDIRLRDLLDEAGRSLAAGVLTDQPEVEAAVRLMIGRTYTDMKMPALGEPHLRRALELQPALSGSESLGTADAWAELARCLCEQRQFDEGIALHRRALALLRALDPGDEATLMRRLWSLSTALRDHNELAEAEDLAREALELALRVYGMRHEATAESRFRLGWILSSRRALDDAEPKLRTALAVQQELLGPAHPACGETLLRLGNTLALKRQYDQAEGLLREAIQVLERSLGPEHPRTSRAASNFARFLTRRGRFDEAETLFQQIAENARQYYGYENGQVASALSSRARVRVQRGDLAGAESLMREALALFAADLGPDDSYTQIQRLDLADLLTRQGCFAAAEPLLLEAHASAARRMQDDPHALQTVLERMVRFYDAWCDAEPDPQRCAQAEHWRGGREPTPGSAP